jgi:hypothetical protein
MSHHKILERSYLIFRPFQVSLNWLKKESDLSVKDNHLEKVISKNKSISARSVIDLRKFDKKLFYSSEYSICESRMIENLKNSKNELEALKCLAQMWNELRFCDLIIISNGREHLAHRVVLSFYSDKYR